MQAAPDKDRISPRKPASRGVRRVKPTKGHGWVAQDRLDLHGKKVEEGLWLLNEFIVGCALRRLRQVLVVTGKGLHSEQGVGVMKQAVEQWILGSGRVYVRTYSDAPRQAGGSGAIVLNLRLGRDGDDL
jgi:DNA-nicking Smr family endonuclease